MMMTLEERKQLYLELRERNFEQSVNWNLQDLGEDMFLLLNSIWGWWKPVYLIDERNKSAMRFMDCDENLLNVGDEDIDWKSIQGLVGEDRAKNRDAHFPTHIREFHDGVAEVEWQVNPDGNYYMDDDGFGMTNDLEEALFGYIDRSGNIVAPFTFVGYCPDYNDDVLKLLRQQAVEIVMTRKD